MYDNSAKITKSIADAAMKVMTGQSQQPETLNESLKGDQHKIDKNKNNKIDAEDFKILRGEKKVEEQASKKKIDKFHTDLDKLVHKSFGHSSDEMKKEEVEQIDELSKQKLGDYAKKASYDAVTRGIDYGSNMDQSGSQHKELSKINKRERGVQKAINRLAKEEVELTESHFKVGDEVICKASGMEGEVVKVDPKEEGKYYTVKREDGKMMKYAPDELKLEDEDEDEKEDKKEKMDEGTKVQVAPGRTRNIGTHGRTQGSAFGGTDWDKEESEKEEKPKTRRKYGARQNYTRSTRVNESFTDMLETYNEGGVKALLGSLCTEIEIEEEATNDEFKAELDKAQAKSEGREKANVAQPLVTASKRFDEEVELEEGVGDMVKKGVQKILKPILDKDKEVTQKNAQKERDRVLKGLRRTSQVRDTKEKMSEEVELEERELSSSEKETKEKYVKGMKKGLQGFKQRYGDRAKEVMHATATKMAKKED